MAEIYDFDDFFVPKDDPGIEVLVPVREKKIPIRVKKAVDFEDRMAAEAAAVSTTILPNGKVQQDMHQEEGAKELVFRCILSWPFTQKKKDPQGRVLMDEAGEPEREAVPLTRENVSALMGDACLYLYMVLMGRLEKDLDPFASPSGEAS